MNKYKIKIPYSYTRYGDLVGYCEAESEEEAREEAYAGDLEDEDYADNDYAGDNDYLYSEIEVDLEEEDIDGDDEQTSLAKNPDIPAPYYLEEINKV